MKLSISDYPFSDQELSNLESVIKDYFSNKEVTFTLFQSIMHWNIPIDNELFSLTSLNFTPKNCVFAYHNYDFKTRQPLINGSLLVIFQLNYKNNTPIYFLSQLNEYLELKPLTIKIAYKKIQTVIYWTDKND